MQAKSGVQSKKVPMWTLIARKDDIAHAAVAEAVLPQDVRVVWYDRGGALPTSTIPNGTVVLLEPEAGWEAGVAALVADHPKVWRFRGAMAAVKGTHELGDDLLHGLQYSVHAALISPLNGTLKGVVLHRLCRQPKIMDEVLLVWLQRAIAKEDGLSLAAAWRMTHAQWLDFTNCADLHITHDRLKTCWGVKPRVVASPKFGTVWAVAATTDVANHLTCMEMRAAIDRRTVHFAVVVVPRMTQDGLATVHWLAVHAAPRVADAWGEAHASQGGRWGGTFPIAGDHVAWLDDLGPSRLDRFLALLPF